MCVASKSARMAHVGLSQSLIVFHHNAIKLIMTNTTLLLYWLEEIRHKTGRIAPTLHLTYRYTKSRGEPHLPCSKRKHVTEKMALEIDRIELSLRFLLTTKRGTNFHAKESSEWLGVAVVAQAICHLTTGRWWPPLKWTRQQVSKYCPTMISHSAIMMPS